MNTTPPASAAPTLAARAILAVLKAYRLLFSAWIGNACRFEPTCSRYAIQAVEQHGAAHGSYLAARRVMRCHPWCAGGLDPVPPHRAWRNAAGSATLKNRAEP